MLGKIAAAAGRFALGRLREPSTGLGLGVLVSLLLGGESSEWAGFIDQAKDAVGGLIDTWPKTALTGGALWAIFTKDRGAKD